MPIRSERQPQFSFQETAALQKIREHDCDTQLAYFLAVYCSLTEIVNEPVGRSSFKVIRKEIAKRSGASTKTVDKVAGELEKLGLLKVERLAGQDPIWTLVLLHEGSAPEPAPDLTPKEPSATVKGKEREFQEAIAGYLDPDDEAHAEVIEDALIFLGRSEQAGRPSKVVTPHEMALAAAALATFNRCFVWKRPDGTLVEGCDYGLGSHLTSIVLRIRERPTWDIPKHVRLVESAWRIRWWESNGPSEKRPHPNVIYGEKSFTNVIQDATDEAAGQSPAEIRKKRRYTRG